MATNMGEGEQSAFNALAELASGLSNNRAKATDALGRNWSGPRPDDRASDEDTEHAEGESSPVRNAPLCHFIHIKLPIDG